jgi:YD repeat-containing protein
MWLILLLSAVAGHAQYTVQITRDIVYGKGWVTYPSAQAKNLLMDMYYPQGSTASNKTALVMIHGGGWWSGDKTAYAAEAPYFTQQGIVCFSIDYRMIGDSLVTVCPGVIDGAEPTYHAAYAAIRDAKAAIRWIRAHADGYGIDKNRIVTLGGSAGGYTAVVAGLADDSDFANDGAGDPTVADNHPQEPSKPNACVDMFGFTIDYLPAYTDEMDSLDPPMLILHGRNDEMVPFQNAYLFKTYCTQHHIPYDFHIVTGGVHGEWFDSTNYWVMNFLDRFLYTQGIDHDPLLAGRVIVHPTDSGPTAVTYDLLGRRLSREMARPSGIYFIVPDKGAPPSKVMVIR